MLLIQPTRTRTGKITQTGLQNRMKSVLGRGLMATFAVLLMSTAGCITHNGKVYHVIIGFGVVRVSDTNQVTVVKANSFGIYAGDGRLNIGVSSVYVAKVPTNSNVILEVTK